MNEKIRGKLYKFVEEQVYLRDLPGMCVSLRIADSSYVKAEGFSNFETKHRMDPSMIFHMASVSKLFTSSAIVKLAEQGKLSLADRLLDILPWIRLADSRFRDITILEMLTHTSGIGDVADYHWNEPATDDAALKKYLMSEEVASMGLVYRPGEGKFSYSNIAYEMLGQIVAEVSQMSFEDYQKKNILAPCGMDNSGFMTFERAKGCGNAPSLADLEKAGLVMPHEKDSDRNLRLCKCYPYTRAHAPSSCLTSDAYDIGKWAEAHISMSFFEKESYADIWKTYSKIPNNRETMGISWFMRRQHGMQLMGHEGADEGFRSSFWICPEAQCYVALMCNRTNSPVKRMGKQIFSIITEKDED